MPRAVPSGTMFELVLGFLLGICACFLFVYLYVFDPWADPVALRPIDQFPPAQILEELANFLKTGDDGRGLSKWESGFSLSLFFQFLFQEHKDSRVVRRWFYKRVQLELNDLTTRYATGRLIQDIRVRELSLGTKFPLIKEMRIEKVDMSADKNSFESITFLINMDYHGGFEASVDVTSFVGKATFSLKVTKLSGPVRLILSRKPFNHWAFSFTSMPDFDFDVSSQFAGHQLRHVIPLITQAFRKVLQKKHVWPNYKIRYRPVFPNPLLQPSPPISAFSHVRLAGGLEVTVLQCTRLNVSSLTQEKYEVYCTVSMEPRPFIHASSSQNSHAISVLLCFPRKDLEAPIGLTFCKGAEVEGRCVRVATVEANTLADEANFKRDDVLLAINNVPIRTERQVTRLLGSTVGDLMVLVERRLESVDDNELFGDETTDAEFTCLGGGDKDATLRRTDDTKSRSQSTDSLRRHSVNFPVSEPPETPSGSITSSIFEQSPPPIRPFPGVNRTESARVPSVLVSTPSVELRRTRSESQLVNSFDSTPVYEVDVEQEIRLENSLLLGRAPSDRSSLQEIESVLPNFDKDKTLLAAHSSASLATSSSAQTLASSRTDGDDESEGRLSRSRPASTRRQKIHQKFITSKQKLSLWTGRKNKESSANPDDEPIDTAVDALEPDAMRYSPSPSPSINKNTDANQGEKSQKKPKKKKKGDSPKVAASNRSSPSVHSRSTKSVKLTSEDVLWGQSLHFALEGETSNRRYLNVTIHAKESGSGDDPGAPTLLGYASLYAPQIIDDCRLTLSNCHREVFHLRPPTGFGSILDSPSVPTELSRHNGFDPRLCYGDITLGFRYFPNGLPKGAGEPINDSDEEEQTMEESATRSDQANLESLKAPNSHVWKTIQCRNGQAQCAHCKGKIWLKSAVCCQRCSVVCHHKCTNKIAPCNPSPSSSDNGFEELSLPGGDNVEEEATVIRSLPAEMTQTPNVYAEKQEVLSRRTRLRNKVAQKFSSWRGKAAPDNKAVTTEKPTDEVEDTLSLVSLRSSLGDVLPQLEGSPHLYDVFYQPGNAYDEETINNARRLGKVIFKDLEIEERRQKINEQIEKIRNIIGVTSTDRLEALKEKDGQETKKHEDDGLPKETRFERLDERLQALAVLMLHYCSALQDCDEKDGKTRVSSEDSDSVQQLLASVDSSPTETTDVIAESLPPTPEERTEPF